MGCDIHFFAEVKIDGTWYCHGHPSIDRCYDLFYKMAGVRSSDDAEKAPIALPKGLPKDLSVVVQKYWEQEKLDAHSASWLGAEEIAILEKWLENWHRGRANGEYFYPEKIWGYLFRSSWGGTVKYGLPEGVQDIRFVFWFDN
jgi:hypothetical protein